MMGMVFRLFDLLLLIPRHLFHQRLRFKKIMDPVHIAEMDAHSLELYPEKMVFKKQDPLTYCIQTRASHHKIEISRITGPHQYAIQYTDSLGNLTSYSSFDPAINGCGWTSNYSIHKKNWNPTKGYYRFKITGDIQESISTFLVSKQSKASVAVFSPVSTWAAYNPYGGKSLYKNFVDGTQVNKVSTQRPNTAVQYKEQLNIHDINVEAQIFNWFDTQYGADLFADYDLENGAEGFDQYQVVVIAYHMEYVSAAMLDTLEKFKKGGKSIIFMGANQCYWKIQWHDAFTALECRKDYRPFENPWSLGGMWRHNLRHEAALQGVAFDDRGMTTYAPYAVTNPNHWLYEGLALKKGVLFGQKGINNLPICGDETDKMNPRTPKGFERIAKGINPENSGDLLIWPDRKVQWDGKGGGDLVIYNEKDQGILSTGSIQSGSGLGTDLVFTKIIENFLKRYLN